MFRCRGNIPVSVQNLLNVVVLIEILVNGSVHQRQFDRLPLVKPFSDWQQCLGFAKRLEFETSRELKCCSLQRIQDLRVDDDNVFAVYLDAFGMVAHLLQ